MKTATMDAQSALAEKLRIDFHACLHMVRAMPGDFDFSARDLITHLCLEAGRIMEDTSVELALTLPEGQQQRADRLGRLHQAGTDIVALAAAAQALHRRYSLASD
jgi:hypothetical protein